MTTIRTLNALAFLTALLLLCGCGSTTAGTRSPDWTATDDAGIQHSLTDYRNAVVVLEFASVDGDTEDRVSPDIARVHQEFIGRPVHVFGVREGASEQAVSVYPTLVDGQSLISAYNVRVAPTVVVIGVRGTIIFHEQDCAGGLDTRVAAVIRSDLASARR